jgi:hypothetical protein
MASSWQERERGREKEKERKRERERDKKLIKARHFCQKSKIFENFIKRNFFSGSCQASGPAEQVGPQLRQVRFHLGNTTCRY